MHEEFFIFSFLEGLHMGRRILDCTSSMVDGTNNWNAAWFSDPRRWHSSGIHKGNDPGRIGAGRAGDHQSDRSSTARSSSNSLPDASGKNASGYRSDRTDAQRLLAG